MSPRSFGCPAVGYEEIESLCAQADYAVISTPPTKRLDYVEMVLKHHVPLYLEKPVACTMEDAMQLKAMAEKYDGKIMVGFAHYYRPAYQKMLELVRTGMFGEPVDIAFSRLSPGFGFHAKNLGASWRTDPDLACGMTVESVSHDWKLITAMAGGFDTISCNYTGTIASVPKFDNHTSISIRLRNGAIGTIAASWAATFRPAHARISVPKALFSSPERVCSSSQTSPGKPRTCRTPRALNSTTAMIWPLGTLSSMHMSVPEVPPGRPRI